MGDGEDVAAGCAETRTAQTNGNKNARHIAYKAFLDSGIANSVRKAVMINQGKSPTGVGPVVVGQGFRLPAVIASATEAVALFLFPKLDFLTKQLRVTRVLVQKRNDGG